MASKLKKGDSVVVLSGRDKGKSGTVLAVFPKEQRAIVEDVNLVLRGQRRSDSAEGSFVKKAAPIHLSNLALKDPVSGKASRVGFRFDSEGRKIRFSKTSGEAIDART